MAKARSTIELVVWFNDEHEEDGVAVAEIKDWAWDKVLCENFPGVQFVSVIKAERTL